MRKLLLLATLLAVGMPTTSQAIISAGVRAGYGVPAGDLSKGQAYKDRVSSQIPLQLDVMFGDPSLQFGLYVGYAVNNLKKSSLQPGETAGTSSTMRAGVQATSRLLDLGLAAIWAGAGTGYEVAQIDTNTPVGKVSSKARGWEFLTLSAGVDLRPIPLTTFGAFVSAGLGQFGVGSYSMGGVETTAGIGPDKRVHQLYQIGVRGMINL